MTTQNTSARCLITADLAAKLGGYRKCEHASLPWHKATSKSHKYLVKTVTDALDGVNGEKRVSHFFIDSIAHLEFAIEQNNEYMRKVYDGYYSAIKGSYVVAYYVDRIY